MHPSRRRHREEEAMMGSADAYGRSHYGKTSDAYGLGSSSAYDMSREPSSSRAAAAAHSHSGSWHSPSSHDPYYSSSNDGYRRDDYDVSVSTHKGWRDHTSSSAHHAAVHDDPYSSSSIYPDSQGWVPRHESRSSGYEKWPAHDDHYHIDDRTSSNSSSWHRSRDNSPPSVDWRRGDSGWETTRHDDRRDNGWDNVRRGSTTDHRVQEDRSWEPAPSWRSNHQEGSGSGQQRYQNRKWGNNNSSNNNNNNNSKGNASKKKKNHHKSSQHYHNHNHHQGTSGRDWRERDDDRGPNNWTRREAQPPYNKGSRAPKRGNARSYSRSRSRSPADSYYSRHSSRGRSRSRSSSPKRQRMKDQFDPSPVSRGRTIKNFRREPAHSRSPSPKNREIRRRTPSTGSRTSRSRSRSASRSPSSRAKHRLPAVTSLNEVSVPSTGASGMLPPQEPPKRNGQPSAHAQVRPNPAPETRTSEVLPSTEKPSLVIPASKSVQQQQQQPQRQQYQLPPPPPVSLPPYPATSSNNIPIQSSTAESSQELLNMRTNGTKPGFKPIGQKNPALKHFFPADEDGDTPPITARTLEPPPAVIASTVVTSVAQAILPPRLEPSTSTATVVTPTLTTPREESQSAPPTAPSPESTARHSSAHDETIQRRQGQQASARRVSVDPVTQAKLHDREARDPLAPSSPFTGSHGELYAIVNQVGEGTFGKVYKARNTVTNVAVALKRIRMETERDGFPVTAMREIKLLQSLRHENVVRLYEMMISNGSVFMVFEYMDHDLTGALSQKQFAFSPANLKSLCHQMLAGLKYLHQKGVIHRDIKGSNILLNNRGELKLADFGLARFYQKRRRSDYTNRVITLWYRPPELLFGATVYGPEVDMWSAGCIMLELFTTKPVFQGDNEIHQLDVIYKIFGTPTTERWPELTGLPWYELVKPTDSMPNRFRELFASWLSPAALDLAEKLLTYDPAHRITAAEALQSPYFLQEDPPAEMPTGLANIEGEWHELETKRERAKKRKRPEGSTQ